MYEDDFRLFLNAKEIADRLSEAPVRKALKNLALAYLLSGDAEEKTKLREEISSISGASTSKFVFSNIPLLACPTREEANGEIVIGKVLHGGKPLYDFGLSREELNCHLLVLGRTGVGKTCFLMNLAKELIRHRIPFIITDFKKDYRALIRIFPEIYVLNWRDLRINLFEPPPGVSFDEWKSVMCAIFSHVHGIWFGSSQMLLMALDRAYEEERGIPRLENVYEKVLEIMNESNSRKIVEYGTIVETRLYGMLSTLGEVFNSERTLIDMEKLMKSYVILELHGLRREEATLILLWLLYYIYTYRRSNNIRGKLLNAFIVDEAKRLWPSTEQFRQTTVEYSGISPIDLICDEIREFGISIVAGDQEPQKLSQSLKANVFTVLCGPLSNGLDIDNMALCMGLSEEERRAIYQLKRGEWLVRCNRIPRPFMIKTEDFPINKDLSDSELRRIMKPKLKNLFKNYEELKKRDKHLIVSTDAYRLLLNVNENPFNGIATRARELRFSATRLEKAKEELIRKELVKQVEISLSGRRPTSFLVLTKKGLGFLKSRKVETKHWQYITNVGFQHVLIQVLIRHYMQKLGFQARIEAKLNNRRIDVLAIKNNKKIGFEIELSPDVNLGEKLAVAKELDALFIVTSNQAYPRLKSKLTSYSGSVYLFTITKLLERLRNIVKERMEKIPLIPNKSESKRSFENKIDSKSFRARGE